MRAAIRPGTYATKLASTTAPRAISTINVLGTIGAGSALVPCANRSHKNRPTHFAVADLHDGARLTRTNHRTP